MNQAVSRVVPAANISHEAGDSQLPGMMAVSGGHPIIDNGRVVGAIGVSGGQNDQDLNAAVTALHAAGFPV
jgi:uncharacterized protein GlcG (DUF336 family)